jgi:hypothetical protein
MNCTSIPASQLCYAGILQLSLNESAAALRLRNRYCGTVSQQVAGISAAAGQLDSHIHTGR